MANAEKKTVDVTKTVVEKELRVVLELTEEEANFLAAVTGMHILGGSEANSAIYGALYQAGFDYYLTTQAREFSNKMEGRIRYNG